jgi:hypothetical protein
MHKLMRSVAGIDVPIFKLAVAGSFDLGQSDYSSLGARQQSVSEKPVQLHLRTIVSPGVVLFTGRAYRQPDARSQSNGPIAAAQLWDRCWRTQSYPHRNHERRRGETGEALMGSMEAYIHREYLIILKRRLADPNITDERLQMLTRLLALEQARGGPEKDDALGAPIHNAQRHSGGHT